MILAFTLSMPRTNSWNGKWSGEDRIYCITRNFTGKKGEEKARKLISEGPYHYDWPDGWGARIDVKHVTPTEARTLRKKSVGFAGYDWMIAPILSYGKIMADHELKDFLAQKATVPT